MADTPQVDVNTDNLEDFTALFNGKATEKVEEVQEPVEDADDTSEQEDEVEVVEEAAEEETPEEVAETEDEDDILKPKAKKAKSAKERIDELTRLRYEAERREADALRRLADLEQKSPQKQKEPETPARTVEAGAPDPDAVTANGELVYPLGEFDPAFVRDLSKFYVRQENEAFEAERTKREEETRHTEAANKLQQDWASKLEEVEKEITDLRPTIATLEAELQNVDPSLGTYLAQTIMGMDVGPQVLYYLANNVDEAQKIIAAGPVGATLALGKLELKIQMSQDKKAKTKTPVARVSSAPTPPVSTRGTASRGSVADDTDDLDAFEAKFFKRK